MNSIGALIVVLLIVTVLCGSRRVALMGMIAGVMYLTQGQQMNVLGFNLFALRFLELAGFFRVMVRREFSFVTLNKVDRALIWLYVYATIVFLLRSTQDQAYVIGLAVDALLSYFIVRGLLGNMEELRFFLCAFLILLAPYVVIVIYESVSRHNLFSIMGGVDDGTWIRNNRLRCVGSFRQPDTLGMFAASFLPLYIGLALGLKDQKKAVIGILLCVIIVWAANAGAAASAAAMGVVGWLFWRWRTQMRKVRWCIAGLLVLLAMVMKAPVWFLLARLSSITGGDGFHRAYLIDVAYRHLGQWWLNGMSINETAGWFAYQLGDNGQADITNQYIAFGLGSGLAAMILFVVLLTKAFSHLGNGLEDVRYGMHGNLDIEYLQWGLGVTLVVHVVNWFAITYFDQMSFIWFMQLAGISSLSERRSTMPDELQPSK